MFKKIRDTSKSICCASKLTIVGIIVYILLSGGVVAWFYDAYKQIKGDETTFQEKIDLLQEQNAKFKKENDRYRNLNSRLRDQVQVIREENEIYAANNNEFERLNKELEATAIELEKSVVKLSGQVTVLKEQNVAYDKLNKELSNQTDTLSNLVMKLEEQVIALQNVAVDLRKENLELNTTVVNLSATRSGLEEEIESLRKAVSFLETYAIKNGQNLDTFIEKIESLITENEIILDEQRRQNLKGDMQYATMQGIEELRTYFDVKTNYDLYTQMVDLYEIGLEVAYSDVLKYICGNVDDFEAYILQPNQSGLSRDTVHQITFKSFLTYMYFYQDDLLNYYFPVRNEGISKQKWKEANYRCSNLDPQVTFYI
mmetsp:Transcript_36540/g.85416  ORF Transcript_36540/g.85416 Transcript_36540/m.85416 type:complete len:371 (-) Transcript_36540:210-1322(-)